MRLIFCIALGALCFFAGCVARSSPQNAPSDLMEWQRRARQAKDSTARVLLRDATHLGGGVYIRYDRHSFREGAMAIDVAFPREALPDGRAGEKIVADYRTRARRIIYERTPEVQAVCVGYSKTPTYLFMLFRAERNSGLIARH